MIGLGLDSAFHGVVLAQVNIGSGPATLLGIALPVAGVALYFLRTIRPSLARDHDIFFAAVSVVCGCILLFQGWRLDPILGLGQFMMTGSAIFFAVESIRLRGVATEQAKRSTPIVDEERPVSRNYRTDAYFEDMEPFDDRDEDAPRRIRGTRDARLVREDEYNEEAPVRRRSAPRGSEGRGEAGRSEGGDRLSPGTGDRPRKRRTPTDASQSAASDPSTKTPRTGGNAARQPNRDPGAPAKSKKSRSSAGQPPATRKPEIDSPAPSSYVDYQPLDFPGESDNSENFD